MATHRANETVFETGFIYVLCSFRNRGKKKFEMFGQFCRPGLRERRDAIKYEMLNKL